MITEPEWTLAGVCILGWSRSQSQYFRFEPEPESTFRSVQEPIEIRKKSQLKKSKKEPIERQSGAKSKGSKDSDSSLVFNENFSKTLWPSGWALGQATWAKMTPKLLHLWRHSQKIRTSQPKNFFRVQSTRLANPFEPLNSSLAQSMEELGRW